MLLGKVTSNVSQSSSSKLWECSTAHTHTMETHSMEKVPSMENFSINQTE